MLREFILENLDEIYRELGKEFDKPYCNYDGFSRPFINYESVMRGGPLFQLCMNGDRNFLTIPYDTMLYLFQIFYNCLEGNQKKYGYSGIVFISKELWKEKIDKDFIHLINLFSEEYINLIEMNELLEIDGEFQNGIELQKKWKKFNPYLDTSCYNLDEFFELYTDFFKKEYGKGSFLLLIYMLYKEDYLYVLRSMYKWINLMFENEEFTDLRIYGV